MVNKKDVPPLIYDLSINITPFPNDGKARFSSVYDDYPPKQYYIPYPHGGAKPLVSIYVKMAGTAHIHYIISPANISQTYYSDSITISNISENSVVKFTDDRNSMFVVEIVYQELTVNTVSYPAPTYSIAPGSVAFPATLTLTPTVAGCPVDIYYDVTTNMADNSPATTSSKLYNNNIVLDATLFKLTTPKPWKVRLKILISPKDTQNLIAGTTYIPATYTVEYEMAASLDKIPVFINILNDTTRSQINSNTVYFKTDSVDIRFYANPVTLPAKVLLSISFNGKPPVYGQDMLCTTPINFPIKETTVICYQVISLEKNPIGGKIYVDSDIKYLYLIKSASDLSGQCIPPVITATPVTFPTTTTVTMTSPNPTASIYYTTDGTMPKAYKSLRYLTPLTISNTTIIRAISAESGKPTSVDSAIVVTKTGASTITTGNIIVQSNVITTTLGLQFIVVKYADGYACRMFSPIFPRTMINGVVQGDFDTIGIISTMTPVATMLLLVEEAYGSLLSTFYLPDNTVKYFRSYSNGKTWEDVTSEIV